MKARSELERIEFLLRRDGYEAARNFVEITLHTYRTALARPEHYASTPHYRWRFEQAVNEFQQWLDDVEDRPKRDIAPMRTKS